VENNYEPYVVELAEKLKQASTTKKAIDPLTTAKENLTLDDAYAIQLYNINEKLNEGKEVVGKKIGLTSKAMQDSLGVNEPDYGHLLNDMVIPTDKPVVYKDQVMQPRVEGELAFVLKDDLVGPDVTVEEVLAATESIVASIEVVDSRVEDWNITLRDTVADNASSAMYVLGEKFQKPDEVDRINVEMQLYKNDELINEGTGADVLGDPAYCVAWLANKLHQYDIELKAGEVILAGALSAAIDAKPGDEFTCTFTEGFGDVSLRFDEGTQE